MTKRDDIRKALLDAKPLSRIVTIYGQKVEIRQSRIGAVLSSIEDDTGEPKKISRKMAFAQLLIAHCYVPGTQEKVFDDADQEVLMEMPFGPDTMALQNAIQDLMGINVETEVKNSAETPSPTTVTPLRAS